MEQLGSRAAFWRFCVITSVESREGDLSWLNANFLCFALHNQNNKNMNMFQKETAKSKIKSSLKMLLTPFFYSLWFVRTSLVTG